MPAANPFIDFAFGQLKAQHQCTPDHVVRTLQKPYTHTHKNNHDPNGTAGQRDSGSHAPEHRRLAIAVYIIEIVISSHLINCALATRPACSFVSRAHVWVCVAIRHQPTHTMHNGVWGGGGGGGGGWIRYTKLHSALVCARVHDTARRGHTAHRTRHP